MRQPKAVIISDIHYNINTLPLADKALRMAIDTANDLKVNIIVAGDLHDTKALLRGECVKAMIDTFSTCKTAAIVLTGNHDLIHEKSPEHSLEFLRKFVYLVDKPLSSLDYHLIPYQSDPQVIKAYLDTQTLPGETVIMHQGVLGSKAGHYLQDKSACPKEWFADYRVISGHYHLAQDIKCGRPRKGAVGLFSYVGNPYTLTFGEANDGPKGFRILYDDGSLELVPTNLRKHVGIERHVDTLMSSPYLHSLANQNDLVWLKVTGPRSRLDALSKYKIMGHDNYKLDLIYTDSEQVEDNLTETCTNEEIFDNIIDKTSETDEQKAHLKKTWRELA